MSKNYKLIALPLAVLASAASPAQAEIFPVFQDTFSTNGAITKAGGKAAKLNVSSKNAAFLDFNVQRSNFASAQVKAARLVLFFPNVNKPGNLDVHVNTSPFQEGISGTSVPQPSFGAAFDTVSLTTALNRSFFTIDVTQQVKNWLAPGADEFGFAVTSDGVATVSLGAKEGPNAGYSAVLEVDLNGANSAGNFELANLGIGSSPLAPFSVSGNQGDVRIHPVLNLLNGTTLMGTYNSISSAGPQQRFIRSVGDFIDIGQNGNGDFVVETNDAARMIVSQNGRLGINTTVPAGALHVRHLANNSAEQDVLFRIDSSNRNPVDVLQMRTFTAGGEYNFEIFEGQAFKPGGGAWGVVSDRRLKKDIEPLNGALARLLKLRSVTYEYKEPEKIHQYAGSQVGFVAQEVEKVFPEWVSENADGFKAVTIRGFESLTVQALRELRKEKDAEIVALKAANAKLVTQLAGYEQRLAALHADDQAREARLVKLEKHLQTLSAQAVTASLRID